MTGRALFITWPWAEEMAAAGNPVPEHVAAAARRHRGPVGIADPDWHHTVLGTD